MPNLLPNRFVLRPTTTEDIHAVSSGPLRHAVFVQDHYAIRRAALRPVKGGMFCTEIFGQLDDSLELDRRTHRFGHIELAVPLRHPWFDVPVRHVAVLPPGYRPFRRTPEGALGMHDLSELYGRLIEINAQLKRLLELGAPAELLERNEGELAKDLARLIDNEGCGHDMFVADARPLRGLAAHLNTEDPEALGAVLFAIGVVAR